MKTVFIALLVATAASSATKSKPKQTPSKAPVAAPAEAAPATPAPADAPVAAPEPRVTPVQSAVEPPRHEVPATGKPRLIVLALTAAGGIDDSVAESLTETLAVEIGAMHLFEVTSQKDVTTMLGLERQKQLVGCSETATSCISELADALGARFVVSGSVAKLGDAYQLNLQTQDSIKATTLGRATRIASDLAALRAQLPYAIAEATATPPPQPPSKVVPVVLMSVGGAGLVSAGVLLLQSFARDQAAIAELNAAKTQPQVELRPAAYYQNEAAQVKQMRVISSVVAGVSAAVLITGVILYPREGSSSRVALVPVANGLGLAGTWP